MTHNFDWRNEIAVPAFNVIETKVKAASTLAFLVGLATQLLGLYVFHGEVPDWVTAGVGSVVTGGLTFLAGWLAKHTPRVDPPVPGSATGSEPGSI
jgi:hypothetical protein